MTEPGAPPIRMTMQRRAVLQVVREACDHPTAIEIFERVRARYPHIAYSTVYTALNALVEAGLVRELRIGKHPTRYDGRIEHHHHALCEGCGRVVEVEVGLCTCQLEAIRSETGFQVRQLHVEIRGLCPECRARKESEDTHAGSGHAESDLDVAPGDTGAPARG
ncbi:MAG: transcriptional repressor [Firmicutes bacterium]|nr:transcriptional repressor [Bacillota bacterium]